MDKRKWVKDAFSRYWRHKASIVKLTEELNEVEMPVPGGTDFSAVGGGSGDNSAERKMHAYLERKEKIRAQLDAAKAKVETVKKTLQHFDVEGMAKGKGHKKYIECRFMKCMGYVRAAMECGISERTGDYWQEEIFAVGQAIAEMDGFFSLKK